MSETICGSSIPLDRSFAPTKFEPLTKMSPFEKIRKSGEYFTIDSVIQNIFLSQVALGCKYFTNRVKKDSDGYIKDLYDEIAKDLNLNRFFKWMYLVSLVYANVYVVEFWGNKVYKVKDKEVSLLVPIGLTMIAPASGRVLGSILHKPSGIGIKVDREEAKTYNENDLNELNKSFVYPIFDGEYVPEKPREYEMRATDKIFKFNEESISHLKAIGFDWERYSTPRTCSVFDVLQRKRKMQEVDFATADGIINMFYIFKLGSDEYPTTEDEIRKFSLLVRNPARAFGLVWNHRVELQVETPSTEVLTDTDKYKAINDEIREGLGFLFVTSNITGRSNVDKLVKIFCENIDSERKEIAFWAEERLYKRIAEKNNLPIFPSIKFNPMSLAIDDLLKALIGLFYDRGLVSKHTSMSVIDLNYEEEKSLKINEEKDKDIFNVPELPFSKPVGTPKQMQASFDDLIDGFLNNLDTVTKEELIKRAKGE